MARTVRSQSVLVCHVTPARNCESILRRGLLASYGRTRRQVTYLCSPHSLQAMRRHIASRHGVTIDDMVTYWLLVPGSILRRHRRGIYYTHCDLYIEEARLP